MAWLLGGPGLATFRRRLRDEVFSAGGSAGLLAVRRAIIGPRAVITEDIRTSSQNLNCQVINPLSLDALRKPKIAEPTPATAAKRPGVRLGRCVEDGAGASAQTKLGFIAVGDGVKANPTQDPQEGQRR